MTALEPGNGDEAFSFKIKQCFWGSINLCMKETTNNLVFRNVGNAKNPYITIAFSYKTKEEPEGQEIIFPGHAISQVLYTSKYQSKERPCLVVLRLLENGYDRMRFELEFFFSHWHGLIYTGQTHCKSFSDNLIFVLDENGLESKNPDDMFCTQTWETGIEPYFNDICRYWSDHLNAEKQIPREYWAPHSDLSVVLSESNFKNFFTSFGLRMTEFNRSSPSHFIGFKTLPLKHDFTYNGVKNDTDDESPTFRVEPGKRTRHLQEFGRQREKEKLEREKKEREEKEKEEKEKEEKEKEEKERNGKEDGKEEEQEKKDEEEKKDDKEKKDEEGKKDEDVEMAEKEKQDEEMEE